jgi:hypothetical protein
MFPSKPGKGARRCSAHGINFPNYHQFDRCPVCNDLTFLLANSRPDEDWADQATALLEGGEIPRGDLEEPEGITNLAKVKVVMRDEHYFIDSRDVVRSDVRHRLNPCDVVRIGKQLFEIIGYSYTRREYLIEPLGVTDEGLTELLS